MGMTHVHTLNGKVSRLIRSIVKDIAAPGAFNEATGGVNDVIVEYNENIGILHGRCKWYENKEKTEMRDKEVRQDDISHQKMLAVYWLIPTVIHIAFSSVSISVIIGESYYQD